jgi:transposase-like protein
MLKSKNFKWKHFEPEIILWGVRWYCRYSISYRDLKEMIEERGLEISHTTPYRWVQQYAPEIDKRTRPYLKRSNDSYRVDETYIKVKGKWKYLYRAVDSVGDTLEFLLTSKRDKKAAKRFFKKMLGNNHTAAPRVISVDKNPAYPIAFDELKTEGIIPKSTKFRQKKYLNNIVEQSRRFIKRLIKNNQWFQYFNTAKNTIAGYEIMNMIRRGQVNLVKKGDVFAQKRFIESLFGLSI